MNNPYAKQYNNTPDDRADRAQARAAKKEAMRQQLQQNPNLLQQLQQNPNLLQQLQTFIKIPDGISILTELLGEMTMNRGGRRRRTFRRRTNKKRSLKRRR